MRARKKLDIDWTDLAFGLTACLRNRDRNVAQTSLEDAWSENNYVLATLSVRSGFDLVLQSLALPKGSEILVSAVTIRDMIDIITLHGLKAVPIDIDPKTCAVRSDQIINAIGINTKAIVVAHLFGSRMPMDEIVSIARQNHLLIIEDCAQAFAADGYRRHSGTDVAMFSFGPIKTATALGGALLVFRDHELGNAARRRQNLYPSQSNMQFLARILKYSAIKILTYRFPYTLFFWSCRLLRTSHDRLISSAVRGFAHGELAFKIRHRPSYPLLALLKRRIERYTPAQLIARIQAATFTASHLNGIDIVGSCAEHPTHWLLPIMSRDADQLVHSLWQAGFDATRGATSMFAVQAEGCFAEAKEAKAMMQSIVYLPVESGAKPSELRKLAETVKALENGPRTME